MASLRPSGREKFARASLVSLFPALIAHDIWIIKTIVRTDPEDLFEVLLDLGLARERR